MEDHRHLRQSLENIEAPKILVIGDMMLDRYTWGRVDRVSPEAPIPIVQVLREDNRLGGAANVMSNLVALGAKVSACGWIGKDESGRLLQELLKKQDIQTEGVFENAHYPTVLKQRVISGQHHLLRVDFDPETEPSSDSEDQLITFLKKTIPSIDLVVASDYGKGVLSQKVLKQLQQLCKEHQTPIIVDPKRHADYSWYEGVTLIKPNRQEAQHCVGFALNTKEDQLRAAEQMKQQMKLDYVLISLDRDGLLLYQNKKQAFFFETQAKEVFDVVGAGDMVVGVLAFLMAGQAPIEHATFWANLAAGMELNHVGVVSFTKEELLQQLEWGHGSQKIVTLPQLQEQLSHNEASLVFTNGFFDNISAGHLKFLQQLQQFSGVKVVAINSDRSIEEQKGERPLLNEKDRAMLLASIEVIDWVLIFDEHDANSLLEALQPQIIVKGERYRNQELAENDMIQKIRAQVQFLPEY